MREHDLSPSSFRWFGWLVALILVAILIAGLSALLNVRRGVASTRLVYQLAGNADTNSHVTAVDMIQPIYHRLDHLPIRLTVTPQDARTLEIVLQTRDTQKIEQVRKLLASSGNLQFLVIANQIAHPSEINAAQDETLNPHDATTREVRDAAGDIVARWVTVGRESVPVAGVRPLRLAPPTALVRDSTTGEVFSLPQLTTDHPEQEIAQWMESQEIASIDVLAIVDPVLSVGGEHLSFAAMTFDENGSLAVAIDFSPQGSARFFALTSNNLPQGGQRNQLGIVLDNVLLSAPNILAPIRAHARITGNFTEEDVSNLVSILKAGQLPAKLDPTPISETSIDIFTNLFGVVVEEPAAQ
jgi:SecD/SecF fusion protein